MHSFRLRYVALGLLIYIQSAFSDTCGSDGFVDVASSTVMSSAVFEGQPKRLARLKDGRVLVLFKVTNILKGNLTGVSNGNDSLQVLVGSFGPTQDRVRCVAPTDRLRLNSRTSYLVFLNRTGRPAQSVSVDEFEGTNFTNYYSKINNASSSVFYYGISGFPENATKQASQEARNYSSLKSATSPRIELNVNVPRRVLKIGQKLQLVCKATGGKPPPLLTWLQNGTALVPSKRLVLRKRGKSLNLVIRKVQNEDAGIYQCVAANVAGSTHSKNVTIQLTNHGKPHGKLCTHQNYCLNEGTCYVLMELAKKLCECKLGFEGTRCQEKTTSLTRMADNKRRLFKRGHGSHS